MKISLNTIPGDFILKQGENRSLFILRASLAEPREKLLLNPPRPEHSISTGKGATRFYQLPGLAVALKAYHHGGLLAPLTRDRYLGPPHRALVELRLLASGEERGLPVISPLGCTIQRLGGPLFRYQLLTRVEAGGHNLLERLRSGERGLEKPCAQALRRLHDGGIFHNDLNLANFIIGERGVVICDLDRGRLHTRLSLKQRAANIQRLTRSVRKQQLTEHFSMTAFCEAYSSP